MLSISSTAPRDEHRFPGLPKRFANDKAVTQSLSKKTGEWYTHGAFSGQSYGVTGQNPRIARILKVLKVLPVDLCAQG